MLGYVYVMSNEAMPGVYKIGCTYRHPSERANELHNTSVPKPFVVEYCINIDNYENIEKLIHKELSSYNFGKEFFKCDLEKCILTIKHIADRNSRYSEAYKDPQVKVRVEGREFKYLRREQIDRDECDSKNVINWEEFYKKRDESRNIINWEYLYKKRDVSRNVINWEEFYNKRDENRY